VGGLGIITGLFILSYHAVIAGWTFGYIFKMYVPNQVTFRELVADLWLEIILFAAFMIMTIRIV